MNCQDAITDLMRSLDGQDAIGEEARAHLRECIRCRALLKALSEERSAIDGPIETIAVAAEAAVFRERQKLIVRRVLGVALAVAAFFILIFIIPGRRTLGLSIAEIVGVTVAGVFIAIIVGAPILLLFSFVSHAQNSTGSRRFYRRLGPGLWLEGTCLGIAQTMGWSVTSVRLVFAIFTLPWFHGAGLLAYLVCTLAMPVHPADRHFMLRFRIARAWRRLRGTDDVRQSV